MEKMIDYIKRYPEMIMDSIQSVKRARLPNRRFSRILVCGMGGSAIGGDLLADLLADRKSPIRVEVSRRYNLPEPTGKDCLVVFSTYSGDTEETLSQFVEARRQGLPILCITSGGKLKQWCEVLGEPMIELPIGFKPRATLPYMLFTVLEYVQQCMRPYMDKEAMDSNDFTEDVEETVKLLMEIREDKSVEKDLLGIADLMKGRRIAVYGTEDFHGAVVRAKNQINENSKLPSSWAVFPELDHNEIEGYEDNDLNGECYVLILRDKEESKEIAARIQATKDIIAPKVHGVVEIWSRGKSKLARMMSLTYQCDILSYYLSVSENKLVDKTEHIDRLKEVLKQKLNTQERLEKEII